MPPTKEQLLARTPLFDGLDQAELRAISQVLVERRFATGETLFREGEEPAGMYLLASGTAKIFKTSGGGREMTIALESAPTTVAELPIFDDGPYPASVAAATDLVAFFIAKSDFRDVCSRHPEVALKVLASVARKLRHLLQTLESITFGSVTKRLAQHLLDVRRQSGSDELVLGTQEELATRLGTVREVVTRNLGRFRAEGLIQMNGASVTILDSASLEREAHSES